MIDCNQTWNGGSFVPSATDKITITNNTKGVWLAFDATKDVKSFLDGNPSNNFGWMIKKTSGLSDGSIAFASRENPDVSHRPQLVLTFSP